MRVRARGAALAAVLAAAVATVGAVGDAGAQSGGKESLEATDVGITANEIRIAVLADVENPLQPGLFRGSPDAMKGFEKYINANGKLAGRRLKVDFIDSHLSADDTRNAIVQACENDFALVGTTSLFVNNVDDMVGCVDAAGKATGLPDFPVLTTEPVHQCSPVSHPINPPTLVCDTIDQHPQTYRAQHGPDLLLPEEEQGPHRRVPLSIGPQVGEELAGSDLPGAAGAGDQARSRVRRVCARAPERVHTDRAEHEGRRHDVRAQRARRSARRSRCARRPSSRESPASRSGTARSSATTRSSSTRAAPMSRTSTCISRSSPSSTRPAPTR